MEIAAAAGGKDSLKGTEAASDKRSQQAAHSDWFFDYCNRQHVVTVWVNGYDWM